jgi:hypothetical protein
MWPASKEAELKLWVELEVERMKNKPRTAK